jgi:PBSX family phage terminase large subunit
MDKEIKVTPFYYDHVLTSNHKVIIQVGGRFSAKSYNEHIRLTGNLASKENYKLLVIEDLETGMADGFHAGLREKIVLFEHDRAYNPPSRTAYIKNLINSNEVLFRGYATEQQRLNVKKLNGITEIVVEEGEWMDYDSFVSLLQQLRGGHEKDRKLTILMNPVNPDCFVNSMFVETMPDKVIERFKDGRPKVFEKRIVTSFEYEGKNVTDSINVLVVMSTHYDNPYLTFEQRASIEQLRDTDPEKYKQLGECKFIRSEGTYFKEFNHGIHVCEPFTIPNDWRRYTTKDYGLDMLANYWIAVDNQGKAYVYKELYESDLIISKAAKRIAEVNGDDVIYQKFAPPDLWNRRQDSGKSATEIFGDNGEYLDLANNNRVQGWLNLKEWLAPYEDEFGIMTANLVIFSNCANLIRCIPQLQRDEKDPNDVATQPHELTHGPDAIRYFVAGRPCPVKPKPKEDHDTSLSGRAKRHLEKIVKKSKGRYVDL